VGTYADYGINAIFPGNYWNSGSSKLQERYFDSFVVSTQRIGCLCVAEPNAETDRAVDPVVAHLGEDSY